MVWTLSQNSTTLTLTPDGTSSADLSALLDQAITDFGLNAGVAKPASLMIADSGFKRILNAASGALIDDAANCRLANFKSASVKTSWNLLVASTVPTTLEITTWQGYLVSAGYSVISFANGTGVVS